MNYLIRPWLGEQVVQTPGSEAMERLHFSECAVQGMDGHRGWNRTNFSIFHPTVPLGKSTRWLSFPHSLSPHFMLYLKLNVHIQ